MPNAIAVICDCNGIEHCVDAVEHCVVQRHVSCVARSTIVMMKIVSCNVIVFVMYL